MIFEPPFIIVVKGETVIFTWVDEAKTIVGADVGVSGTWAMKYADTKLSVWLSMLRAIT